MSTDIVDNQRGLNSISLFLLCLFFSFYPTIILAKTKNWQGAYVGAYLGGGIGKQNASTHAGTVSSTSYFTTLADINAVNHAGTWTNNPTAVIGGIKAGNDWVWEQYVYGVVLDYGSLSLKSSEKVNKRSYPDHSDTYSIHTSINTNWLFTLRGRLGHQLALDWPGLLYLTGGMALTQLQIKNNFSDTSSLAGLGRSSSTENKIGWIAGMGIELATFDHTSMTLEYLYVKTPSVKTKNFIFNTEGGFGIPPRSLSTPFSTTGRFHASLLKIELNYRF